MVLGIDVLELEVPDHLGLLSCYGAWNNVLDSFIDGVEPDTGDVADCYEVQRAPRRGRPPIRFPGIQACLPYIEPAWLVASEPLDTQRMMEENAASLKQLALQYNITL